MRNDVPEDKGNVSALIEMRGIEKEYHTHGKHTSVLKEIDITIGRAEFVALLGPSGSGKTTLLSILGLLLSPSKGSYSFEGRNVGGLDDRRRSRIRNERIGFVFQLFHLLPRVNAVDNVLLPLLYGRSLPHGAKRRAAELLGRVGLKDRLAHTPESLSGGQQQRVAIARALINEPPVLLADEPTGNLDRKSADDILDLFGELHRAGTAIILVTHDAEVATRATRVLRLRDGRIVEDTAESRAQVNEERP